MTSFDFSSTADWPTLRVVEIFFRFFKHVLGCRHPLSGVERVAHNPNGIKLQTYAAIICRLLIALYTGREPTLRTYEMLCHHLSGLATADELEAHLAGLEKPARVTPGAVNAARHPRPTRPGDRPARVVPASPRAIGPAKQGRGRTGLQPTPSEWSRY